MAWDNQYRMLRKGETIMEGDEVDACRDGWRDEPAWKPATECIGQPAPDPAYPSHRVYRRKLLPCVLPTEAARHFAKTHWDYLGGNTPECWETTSHYLRGAAQYAHRIGQYVDYDYLTELADAAQDVAEQIYAPTTHNTD